MMALSSIGMMIRRTWRHLLLTLFVGIVSLLLVAGSDDAPKQVLMPKVEVGLTENVILDPDSQNIPRNPDQQHLRPPPPRLVPEHERTIFIGTVSFRDGHRCGNTLFTALSRAKHPELVRIGVVDQVLENDLNCLDAYCQMARAQWGKNHTSNTLVDDCPYRTSIRIDSRNASQSRGPNVARHYEQLLIRDDDEFCMQIDSHTIFTNDWDVNIVQDWLHTDNEMAILTTYLHHIHNFVADNGDNRPPNGLPHLCGVKVGGHFLVRNEGATLIQDMVRPQMQSLLGAGFVFGKCHAERCVPIDLHTQWIFDGEEYTRAAGLWTAGYDLYSPTGQGHAVYHNYTSVPARYYDLKNTNSDQRTKEEQLGANRLKLHLGMEFRGMVDTTDLQKFSFSTVRRLDQFLNFSGVSLAGHGPKWQHNHTCYQLHWVPYDCPHDVEALLPGWKLHKQQPALEEETLNDGNASSTKAIVDESFSNSHFMTWEANKVQSVQFVVLASLLVVLMLFNKSGRCRVSRRSS